MKCLWLIALLLSLAAGCQACSPNNNLEIEQPSGPVVPDPGTDLGENPSTHNRMKITVGNTSFTAILANNSAANAFKELLPMTVSMGEHAGNEKFYDLPRSLTTASSNPGTIQNGDIMLYGSRTLVLFYQTFRTSYSYTRIGSVDDPSGLERALGRGSVTITFELAEIKQMNASYSHYDVAGADSGAEKITRP